MENGKKNEFCDFIDFSNFWKQMEKKNLIIMKKKILCRKIEFWATAQVYCKARQLGWALG